ncbi:MAG: cardiolipin synthase [Eubacterium sp.]|nr:cardiolipin synthase [Eubacterium sp.]
MKRIIGRILIVLPAIALQVGFYVVIYMLLNRVLDGRLSSIITAVFTLLGLFFVIHIVNKRDESAYKLLWTIVLLLLPVLGAMMYLTLGNKKTGKKLKRSLQQSSKDLLADSFSGSAAEIESRHAAVIGKIREEEPRIAQTLNHVMESTHFPILVNGTSKYYQFGELGFADMCEDLKTAEKYVYLEYFIIESGKFWDTLVDLLAERASAGVDVRVMYDDFGSLSTYSRKDIKYLATRGIKCIAFNPFFLIKSQLNNRDHRKIMVIDGRIAYSGGINLADEYINETHPFGKWKDLCFRLTGPAVRSYTYMFAEFWDAFSNDKIPQELLREAEFEEAHDENNGYILPYYDSPMRNEPTSNTLFTEMLSMATEYVWFYTPYLMLGDTLFDAFIRAARRGIDVRIITPAIPDQKMVHRIGRSHYGDLIQAGVKIYEYTPGFVHAKAVLMDGKLAGIGTVNLDYRSLFLHFECYSVFYKSNMVDDLKNDYEETLKDCHQITFEEVQFGVMHRLGDSLLRVIAPLM